jgi:hypothetical protein
MPTYEDLIRLANICARQARDAKDRDLAAFLSKMAREYQAEAAKLDSRKLFDGRPFSAKR